MDEITFLAQVQTSRQPKWGLAILLFVILVLVAILIIRGVLEKSKATLYLVLALPLLVGGIRNNAATRQQLQTLVTMSVGHETGTLELKMASARQLDGEYVDALYVMALTDIEYVDVHDGRLGISSYRVVGKTERDDRTVTAKNLDRGYISMDVADDDCCRLRSFICEFAPTVEVR